MQPVHNLTKHDLAEEIQYRVENFKTSLRGICTDYDQYCNTPEELVENVDFLKKVDEKAKKELSAVTIKKQLKKEYKLTLRTLEYLETGSIGVDPRVEQLLSKCSGNDGWVLVKRDKYRERKESLGDALWMVGRKIETIENQLFQLKNNELSKNCNQATKEACAEVQKRLDAVYNYLQTLEEAENTETDDSSDDVRCISDYNEKSIVIDNSCNNEPVYYTPIYIPQKLEDEPVIKSMLSMIDALSLQSDEGFDEAMMQMINLCEFTQVFDSWKMQGTKSLGDRVFFHLYQIQNKETPNKIDRNDSNYGYNAFHNPERSTPEERLRAAKRVLLDAMFEVLMMKAERNESKALSEIIELLEKINLDPRDLPDGKTNVAHALFGKMYNDCNKAFDLGSSLINPQDGMFNGDFGRSSLIGEASNSISIYTKAQVFREFIQSVHQHWGI